MKVLIFLAVVLLGLCLFLLSGLLFFGAPPQVLVGIASTGFVGGWCAYEAYSERQLDRAHQAEMEAISRQYGRHSG